MDWAPSSVEKAASIALKVEPFIFRRHLITRTPNIGIDETRIRTLCLCLFSAVITQPINDPNSSNFGCEATHYIISIHVYTVGLAQLQR